MQTAFVIRTLTGAKDVQQLLQGAPKEVGNMAGNPVYCLLCALRDRNLILANTNRNECALVAYYTSKYSSNAWMIALDMVSAMAIEDELNLLTLVGLRLT